MPKGVQIKGVQNVVKSFDLLSGKQIRSILRKGVRAGAKPVVKKAKANLVTSKRTGLLRKSLGIMSIRLSNDQKSMVGFMGPRKGKEQVVTLPSGRKVKVDPRRYAHLVELGTKRSKKNPFMRSASITEGPSYRKELAKKTKLEIGKFAAKRRAKSGGR